MNYRWLAYLSEITAMTACAVAAVLGLALWDSTHQNLYDPLGEFPLQTVTDITVEVVTVEGTKCNDSDLPVAVYGELGWQRMDPLGFSSQIRSGSNTRQPGCITSVFVNDIPEEVLEVNEDGDSWRIFGTEWPIDPNTGERGKERVWATQNFEIPSD